MKTKASSAKYLDRITWDDIDWNESFNKVRTLQSRIFKASLSNDRKKAQWLQTLLLRNPHAKLIAVYTVTTLNRGKKTPGIDQQIITSKDEKIKLARSLFLNGKTAPIKRVWIPKRNGDKRPLGIPTIRDRAKQCLCKLALEPYWEAKFEPNSYGFRPGRSAHDAVEAIFSNLHHNTDKWVFEADIQKCFEKIDHQALLEKLEAPAVMENQISSWLKAGIIDEYAQSPKTLSTTTMGTPQGGIISPLLANIALHGLEEHLLSFVSDRKFPKPHPNAANGKRAKRSALGIIRYADDFVIIHRNKNILDQVIPECEKWLSKIGLKLSPEKCALKRASQSFSFLGFQITYIGQNDSRKKGKVLITPSKKNVQQLLTKTRDIIQSNKSASAHKLCGLLRPIIMGWGNYFQYCECKETFRRADNMIYQQLRAWVLRRAIRQGRIAVMEKYFPNGNSYTFQGRTYKANWVLYGETKTEKGTRTARHVPKLSWISSKKFIKIQGSKSIYDGDNIYWALRNPRYSLFSYRKTRLLTLQKGLCSFCKHKFVIGDTMEVDHIIPRSKGGVDRYKNLQLLHRHCHLKKTKEDLSTNPLVSPDGAS